MAYKVADTCHCFFTSHFSIVVVALFFHTVKIFIYSVYPTFSILEKMKQLPFIIFTYLIDADKVRTRHNNMHFYNENREIAYSPWTQKQSTRYCNALENQGRQIVFLL